MQIKWQRIQDLTEKIQQDARKFWPTVQKTQKQNQGTTGISYKDTETLKNKQTKRIAGDEKLIKRDEECKLKKIELTEWRKKLVKLKTEIWKWHKRKTRETWE